MENVVERSVKRFLLLILVVDVMLIGMHLVQLVMPLDPGHYLSIANEKSLGEAYRHIKFFWVLVLLVLLMFRRAAPLFFVWFLFFAGVLFLDIFEYHGMWGQWLMATLTEYNLLPAPGETHNDGVALGLVYKLLSLNSAEAGEVVFATIVAAVMLILLLVGYINADNDTRRMTRRLVMLSAAYAFFAVGVDYVFAIVSNANVATALGIIEEAGQLVVLSLMLFYLYRHEVWHSSAG